MKEIPILKENDYLKENEEFWKSFRQNITEALKVPEEKLDKTKENIYLLAKKIGIKPTARYFSIEPSQVRYYIKQIEKTQN